MVGLLGRDRLIGQKRHPKGGGNSQLTGSFLAHPNEQGITLRVVTNRLRRDKPQFVPCSHHRNEAAFDLGQPTWEGLLGPLTVRQQDRQRDDCGEPRLLTADAPDRIITVD